MALVFNGLERTITVSPGTSTLDIRADLYTDYINWLEDNNNWPLAIRYSGLDPIPGGESGGIFFLQNGWKLIIDFTVTQVIGVLYSDNFNTPFWNSLGQPLYPAVVSSLVNSSVSYQNVVTGTALNAEEIRQAVWNAPVTGMSTTGSIGEFISKKLLTLAKFIGLK